MARRKRSSSEFGAKARELTLLLALELLRARRDLVKFLDIVVTDDPDLARPLLQFLAKYLKPAKVPGYLRKMAAERAVRRAYGRERVRRFRKQRRPRRARPAR